MKILYRSLVLVAYYMLCAMAGRGQNPVTAGFTSPDHVCVNTALPLQNTSVNATNYYWSFCAADFSSAPQAINLGNPGNQLSAPTFSCYGLDDNGNYYGLVMNYNSGEVIRLNFGTSLLNSPSGEDLGNFNDALPVQGEGIQLLRVNGIWSAIIVGGSGVAGPNSSPRIVKLDFGSSLASTPVATNWGNVGNLGLPHDLFITQEAGNYYGFAINVNDNTITRLSFGPDFTGTPMGVNLGNIGNIDYPAGFTFVHYSQNWYAFIANRVTNSLTRLDFGASLLNTPAGVNIGNPGQTLSYPRDISLFTVCDGIYGFVVNEQSNELIKLNFGFDLTSSPQATDLGNIGNFSFPHSISDFFRVGNDIYAFIPSVTSSSLTRIRFAGCQDIPGSTQASPPPIIYKQPGTYNINLLVDLGLPTQTSFCRQVIVNDTPQAAFKGETLCNDGVNNAVLSFAASAGTAPFDILYSDGTNTYPQNGLSGNGNVTLPYALSTGTTTFTLQSVLDANGCKGSPNSAADIVLNPLPQGGIAGNSICSGDSAVLVFTFTEGISPFKIEITDGTNTSLLYGIQSGAPFSMPPLTTNTVFSLLSITDQNGNGCTRTSGFTTADAAIMMKLTPKIQFDPLASTCIENPSFLITQATEVSGIAGSGVYAGTGIDAAGNYTPSLAGTGTHVITYTYMAADGCTDTANSPITVNPSPVIQTLSDISSCSGVVQLSVSGGVSYTWSPASLLDDPTSATPVVTVDTTTVFVVGVTDQNGCTASEPVTVHTSSKGKSAFLVPNAFTPNGDGHNDCFGIQHWGEVTVQEFSIFNRWGQRVFSTRNAGECWDGTLKGTPQPAGGYPYVIRVTSFCGEITRTGLVMLIR